MNSRVIVVAVAVLLTSLALSQGMSLGVELHCRCIVAESKHIGRHIEKVELFLPSSHCEDIEVIATLKSTGKQVCLDLEALWVKKLMEKILSSKQP